MSHMWQDYYDSRKDEIVTFESDGEVDMDDDEEAIMVNDRDSPREPDGLFVDDLPEQEDEYDDHDQLQDLTFSLTKDTQMRNNSYMSPRTQRQKFALNDDSLPYVNNLHSLRKVQPDKIKIYKFRTVLLAVFAIFALGMTLGFVLREEEDKVAAAKQKPVTRVNDPAPVDAPVKAPVSAPVSSSKTDPNQKIPEDSPNNVPESPVQPPVQPPVQAPVEPPVQPPVFEEPPRNPPPTNPEFPGMGTEGSLSMDEVRNFLASKSVSNVDLLQTEGSAQYRALHWISMVDPAQLPIPRESDTDAVYKYIQRYVMAVNYYATGGDGWKHKLSFLGAESICGWLDYVGDISHKKHNTGIGCNSNKDIEIFSLDFMEMTGQIPTENGLLTTLREFNVAGNSIEGKIPTEICSLTKLQVFAIDKNMITGSLPSCFVQLQEMEGLGLGDNLMVGSLPQLKSYPNLMQLLINNNAFEGKLEIGDMPHLEILDAKANEFSSILDADMMGGLKNLKYVDLSDNMFQSTHFPNFFFNLNQLEVLDVSQNSLKGGLPSEIKTLTNLKYLAVHKNSFSGEIPYALKNLVSLTHINLGDNDFTGRFPLHLGELTNLEVIYMPDLPLLDKGRMPDEFLTLDKLKILSLRNTNRFYFLPEEFSMLKHLEYLDVSNNDLNGGLPVSWGEDFIYMRVLNLSGNYQLKGEIPDTFKKLGSLGQLFIQGTDLDQGLLPELCSTMILAEGYRSIVATCNQVETDCTCCQCCNPSDTSCGYDMIAAYDKTWDSEFRSTLGSS